MAKSEDREPDAAAEPQGFSEAEFKTKLREIGRLREPTGKVPKPEGEFIPVEVQGKPLSECVVEEQLRTEHEGPPITLVCSDQELNDAASKAGLVVVNPEDEQR